MSFSIVSGVFIKIQILNNTFHVILYALIPFHIAIKSFPPENSSGSG